MPCRVAPPSGLGRRAWPVSPGRPRCGISSPSGATSEAPADIFKGDAPKGEVWELWRKRGWVKEASHYLKLGRNVQCKVCPNNCLLAPGDRSHCRNKVNHDGTLYTLAYANPCTFHVDPVEKKPLFHFLPGSRTFSLATSGCVFRCLNCQNWEISQKKPEETKDPRGAELRLRPPLPSGFTPGPDGAPEPVPGGRRRRSPRRCGCPSISYTYSEPTAFYEYTYDTCKAARERKLKNIVVSCGSIEDRPARDLYQFVDAAHVDLKGFDEETYTKLNSGKLQPILNTLKTLKELGVWFEIINLVVPTYTDNLGHHPPHVRLDRQGAGAGPAAALLALPSAAQARVPARPRRSRRWSRRATPPAARACATSISATCPASKARRRPGVPTARRPSSSATSSPSPP